MHLCRNAARETSIRKTGPCGSILCHYRVAWNTRWANLGQDNLKQRQLTYKIVWSSKWLITKFWLVDMWQTLNLIQSFPQHKARGVSSVFSDVDPKGTFHVHASGLLVYRLQCSTSSSECLFSTLPAGFLHLVLLPLRILPPIMIPQMNPSLKTFSMRYTMNIIVLMIPGSRGCMFTHPTQLANKKLTIFRYAEVLEYHKQSEAQQSVRNWAQAVSIAQHWPFSSDTSENMLSSRNYSDLGQRKVCFNLWMHRDIADCLGWFWRPSYLARSYSIVTRMNLPFSFQSSISNHTPIGYWSMVCQSPNHQEQYPCLCNLIDAVLITVW